MFDNNVVVYSLTVPAIVRNNVSRLPVCVHLRMPHPCICAHMYTRLHSCATYGSVCGCTRKCVRVYMLQDSAQQSTNVVATKVPGVGLVVGALDQRSLMSDMLSFESNQVFPSMICAAIGHVACGIDHRLQPVN